MIMRILEKSREASTALIPFWSGHQQRYGFTFFKIILTSITHIKKAIPAPDVCSAPWAEAQAIFLEGMRTHRRSSKNPRAWSERYRTPILCCIKDDQYADAKKAFSTLNSSTQSESDIRDALAFLQKADFFHDIASADYRNQCFLERVVGDYKSLIPAVNTVRNELESTGISAYEWNDNPFIRSKISSMAAAEYNAGGSDKVVNIIEGMGDAELKKWLTDIARKDMGLGIKIIINREE